MSVYLIIGKTYQMTIKLDSRSISRSYYDIDTEASDLSDFDSIHLFTRSNNIYTLPFRVGQIRCLKRGKNTFVAIHRISGASFEYLIVKKESKKSMERIEVDFYNGSVNDLIDLIYKYNFEEKPIENFHSFFTNAVKSIYLLNKFSQLKIQL